MEVVEEDVTGFWVDERNVEGVAEHMVQVLTNGQLRTLMGRTARRRIVERYESNHQAERLRTSLFG